MFTGTREAQLRRQLRSQVQLGNEESNRPNCMVTEDDCAFLTALTPTIRNPRLLQHLLHKLTALEERKVVQRFARADEAGWE